ncbi:MAG: SDR family NAD(P)-dependent oxidoreductase [Polyangiaceae bacterium]|nr:SDR family NAD(P)-dependent oxidoreductase [Polyangiaceae bacterium]
MLSSLGALHVAGADVDWRKSHPDGQLLSLPAYPWDRQVLWEESKAALRDRHGDSGHPLLQLRGEHTCPTWQGELSQYWLPYLSDHKVYDSVVFPGAGYVEAALVAATHMAGDEAAAVIVEDLRFLKALTVPDAPVLRMSLDRGTNRLEIHSRPADESSGWCLHATGKVLADRTEPPSQALDKDAIVRRIGAELDREALYDRMADQGLRYGPSFRGVQRIWAAGGEVLAEISMGGADDPDYDAYHMHPRLLDPCFQSLIAAAGENPREQRRPATPYLPVAIRQVRLHRQVPGELVCYGRVCQHSEQSIAADLTVSDRNGQVVAEIVGLQLKAVMARRNDSAVLLRHAMRWIPQPEDTATAGRHGATWAVIARDEAVRAALCDALRERQCTVLTAAARWGDPSTEGGAGPVEELAALISEAWPGNLTGVVYVPAVDARPTEATDLGKTAVGARHCTELLALLQALVALDVHGIKLAIVTAGAQPVEQQQAAFRPDHAALWGFGRVIENEHPSLATRLVDLDPADACGSVQSLLQELLGSSAETEVAFRHGQRYVHRLVRVPDEEAQPFLNSLKQTPYVLRIPRPGSIDNLEYQQVRRRAPGPGQVEIAVMATALNFKDLMKVMNILPDAYLDRTFFGRDLGVECAGVVVRVGEGVTEFSVGDEVVCADGEGAFRSYATVPTRFMVRRPGPLKLEQSVQFVNLVTPYYGLVELAQLRAGETVLIHSACGGVGLGAVRIAQLRGARVIATAGHPDKRQYLRDLGLEHVSDSRSLAFVDDVLRWTNGRGVDVVLNSLQGEKLAKSFELLAPYGRFIEIGKRDINANEVLSMAPFSRNLTFSAVDIDVMMADNPQRFRRLVDSVWKLLDSGTLEPPPVETFGANDVHAAFSRMGRAQHIGKIVVRMDNQVVPVRRLPHEVAIDPSASYLITGGWGGFGLAVSRWFASQGAKHLVILSRSGCQSAAARRFASAFTGAGGQLTAPNVDISDASALETVLAQLRASAPPLRGIVHAAAALDDGLLSQLDEHKLWRVMAPKALGAWNLHGATANQDLDFFVCFSSVSALVGNVGQANYAAANAFLDALAHYRRSIGLPGVTVNWGALAQVGMVARDAAVQQRLKQQGIEPIPLDDALQALSEVICRSQHGQVGFMHVDWQRFAASNPGAAKIPRYAELMAISDDQRPEATDAFRDRLCAAAPADQLRMAEEFLAVQISTTLRLPVEKLDTRVGLEDLGMDSLMATELRSVVHLQTGLQLPTMLLLRGPTIAKLAHVLVDLCQHSRASPSLGPDI